MIKILKTFKILKHLKTFLFEKEKNTIKLSRISHNVSAMIEKIIFNVEQLDGSVSPKKIKKMSIQFWSAWCIKKNCLHNYT